MDIRKVIRDRRKSMKITQEELSGRIGIGRVHYLGFENGKHGISDIVVEKILDELGLILFVIPKEYLDGKY